MIRKFLLLIALILALFLVGSSLSAEDPSNVVFFLVDDLGWTDVGTFGSSFYETPNIDAFAEDGLNLPMPMRLATCVRPPVPVF